MAQVTALTPVAKAVGYNRIVQAKGIVYDLTYADSQPTKKRIRAGEQSKQALVAVDTEGWTTH